MDGQSEVGEARAVVRHYEDVCSDPLQDLDLPYDDGAAPDDETALVPTAESACGSACQDGGGYGSEGHDRIMTEARVGRLLAACLHQGIFDELPQRLEYYEAWLGPDALRDGLGLAPITAVLGFLRTERDGAHDRVMSRAGSLAADWTIDSLPAVRLRVMNILPRWFRARAAARVASAIVRDVLSTSRASTRVRRAQMQLNVTESLFCSVREPQTVPLCAFYSAVAARAFERFGLSSRGRIEECRAVKGRSCVIHVDFLSAAHVAADSARAA
jgi:hypothetical protein